MSTGSPMDELDLDLQMQRDEWEGKSQLGYADSVYRFILTSLGKANLIKQLQREAREKYNEEFLLDHMVMDACPEITVWLGVKRIKSADKHFDPINQVKRFTTTTVYDALVDLREEVPETWPGSVGLIFTHPKMPGGYGRMLLIDGDYPLIEWQARRRILGRIFTYMRLTEYLASIRRD